MRRAHRIAAWRRRVYQILDVGFAGDAIGHRVHVLLIMLVLLTVGTVVLESVPALDQQYGQLFAATEIVTVFVFTLEYVARIWVAPEHGPLMHFPAWRARLNYIASPSMVLDLLGILPFFLAYFVSTDLRILLLLRLSRYFKLARYSIGMRSLMDAVYAERNALVACLVILFGLVILSASFMHMAEHAVQPDKFGTIPQAMYWAVITLATVGYGDVVPVTGFGKVIASLTAVLGLCMVALPVGILATAFSEVIHRRDFVVTWGMLARVPLFKGLDAQTIAEIMRYLRSQTVQAGQVIARRGEPAHSMYFIAAGEVQIDLPGKHVQIGIGDFFGEIALLKDVKRTATAHAITRTSLLVLEKRDLHALMDERPDVGERIADVARQRLPGLASGGDGDLIPEEMTHHSD